MKKISLDLLQIEITRRCNLKCKHCFRGEAEELDITKETIDNLFKQIDVIAMLQLTGGEPTTNIEMMEYIIKQIEDNNITLGQIQITTNGIIKEDRLIRVLKKYSDYVKTCIMPGEPIKKHMQFFVSCDVFHVELIDAEENYVFFKQALDGYFSVNRLVNGNLPIREGRAENLPYSSKKEIEKEHKIEYITKEHKALCKKRKMFNLMYDEQIIVLCSLYVSANGKIYANMGDYKYSRIDEIENICNISLNENIFDGILKFNENKLYCIELSQEKNGVLGALERFNKNANVFNMNQLSLAMEQAQRDLEVVTQNPYFGKNVLNACKNNIDIDNIENVEYVEDDVLLSEIRN